MFENGQFFTLHETAAKFGVSYQMVYNLVRTGELPAFRFGKSYRVAERDLEAYLRKQRVQVPKEPMVPTVLRPGASALSPQLIAREANRP